MNVVEILKTANEVGAPWAVCILISIALIALIKNTGKSNKIVVDTATVLSKAVQTMEAHTVATNNLSRAVDTNFNPFSERMNDGLSRLSRSVDTFIVKNDLQFKQLLDASKANYLSTDQSITIYRNMANTQISSKLEFIGKILKYNSLAERTEEIKRNIIAYFKTITTESINTISAYKSVVGDMGRIVEETLDWEELFKNTFEIVFSKHSTEKQKINDLKMIFKKEASEIENKIREAGERN